MISNRIRQALAREDGNVAIETAMVLPVLLIMLLGSIELGSALLVNKKVTSATQIVSDLVAREIQIDDPFVADLVFAAELALDPYAVDSLGLDIVGICFEGTDAVPAIRWRETINMTPVGDILTQAEGLGDENEGVVAVTVAYTFNPPFAETYTGTITMSETSFARGRRTSFVQKLGEQGCP